MSNTITLDSKEIGIDVKDSAYVQKAKAEVETKLLGTMLPTKGLTLYVFVPNTMQIMELNCQPQAGFRRHKDFMESRAFVPKGGIVFETHSMKAAKKRCVRWLLGKCAKLSNIKVYDPSTVYRIARIDGGAIF